MAPINSIRGTQVLIKVGDGASPEVFAQPCLINTERGIQFTSQGNDTITIDCDDPDAPAWLELVKDGMSCTVTGSGTLDLTSVPEFDAWFRDDVAKNVQLWLGTNGHWVGAFKLTEWNITGNRGTKAEVSITLRSEGEVDAYVAA